MVGGKKKRPGRAVDLESTLESTWLLSMANGACRVRHFRG